MVSGLAAIAAVLGAAAGLDRQQARQLHFVGIEVAAMNGRGAEKEIVEREIVDGLGLGPGPDVTGLFAGRFGRARVNDVDVH